MQIERTASYGAATKSTAVSTEPATTAGASPQAGAESKASTSPLSGGSRTVSVGIFNEAESGPSLSVATLAELVANKTRAFSQKLTAALEKFKIPTDEPIGLHVDAAGKVSASGPYKNQVEKMFKDDPELAKELKDIAGLNALVALNEAMKRFARAKERARDDDDAHKKAEADYIADCLTIQARSGTMVLEGGQLTSGALDYMNTVAQG